MFSRCLLLPLLGLLDVTLALTTVSSSSSSSSAPRCRTALLATRYQQQQQPRQPSQQRQRQQRQRQHYSYLPPDGQEDPYLHQRPNSYYEPQSLGRRDTSRPAVKDARSFPPAVVPRQPRQPQQPLASHPRQAVRQGTPHRRPQNTPSMESHKDRVVASGIGSSLMGMAVAGPVGAAVAGFSTAFAADTKTGLAGDAARAVGDVALVAFDKTKQLNQDHDLTQKAQHLAQQTWETAQQIDRDHKVVQTAKEVAIYSGVATVEFCREHRVVERGLQGLTQSLGWVAERVVAGSLDGVKRDTHISEPVMYDPTYDHGYSRDTIDVRHEPHNEPQLLQRRDRRIEPCNASPPLQKRERRVQQDPYMEPAQAPSRRQVPPRRRRIRRSHQAY